MYAEKENTYVKSEYIVPPFRMQPKEPFEIRDYGESPLVHSAQESRCIPSGTRIEYVLSGHGTLSTRDYSSIVRAGDTIVLPQGMPCRYHSDPKAPIRKVWITVSGELVSKMMKLYRLDGSILFREADSSAYLSQMITVCEQTEEVFLQKEKVGGILCELLHFLNRQKQMAPAVKGDRLDAVREYIHLHIWDNITIEDLCEISKATPNHTIRTFKQKFGITPHRYILELKLKSACNMLSGGNRTVGEIAEQLGFNSSGHFSEVFYKYYGIRPSDYRNRYAGTKNTVTLWQGIPALNSQNYSCNVQAGDTYILHEGDNHNYFSDTEHPMDKVWINVTGALVKELVSLYRLNHTLLFRNVDASPYIDRMHEICKSTQDPYEIQEKGSGVFCELIQFLARQKQTDELISRDFLDDICAYIDLHIEGDLSIEKLCEFSQKSPNQTIRLFKKKFGITPHQYILKLKLGAASTMLRSSEISVERIASRLRFSSTGTFSDFFYKHTGMRPSEYRRMHRITE